MTKILRYIMTFFKALTIFIFGSILSACALTGTPPEGSNFDKAELDYYRRSIARGLSPEHAALWVRSEEGRRYVASRREYYQAIDCYGSRGKIPKDAMAKIESYYDDDIAWNGEIEDKTPIKPFVCSR